MQYISVKFIYTCTYIFINAVHVITTNLHWENRLHLSSSKNVIIKNILAPLADYLEDFQTGQQNCVLEAWPIILYVHVQYINKLLWYVITLSFVCPLSLQWHRKQNTRCCFSDSAYLCFHIYIQPSFHHCMGECGLLWCYTLYISIFVTPARSSKMSC